MQTALLLPHERPGGVGCSGCAVAVRRVREGERDCSPQIVIDRRVQRLPRRSHTQTQPISNCFSPPVISDNQQTKDQSQSLLQNLCTMFYDTACFEASSGRQAQSAAPCSVCGLHLCACWRAHNGTRYKGRSPFLLAPGATFSGNSAPSTLPPPPPRSSDHHDRALLYPSFPLLPPASPASSSVKRCLSLALLLVIRFFPPKSTPPAR